MRADRLVSLMLLLQGGRLHTAEELARRLEVSPRTIYRDLEALSASGVPVRTQAGAGGGVSLRAGWRTELGGLTAPELEALAGAGPAEALEELGLSAPLARALLKLVAALPAVERAAAERARERLHVDGSPFFGGRERVPHLGALREAIFADRKVRLSYRDFDGRRSVRVVDPYALVVKADRWYLVAGSGGEPRVFRGGRIAAARVLASTFERPAGFELRSFWRRWCERFTAARPSFPVELRLSAEAAEALAAMRPPRDQEAIRSARPRRDGRIDATLDFERMAIALSQLVPLGRGAEVRAPLELRERLAALGADLRAVYRAGARRRAPAVARTRGAKS